MLAQDYTEPYETPEPDGCNCEQALQVTCDRLSRENHSLRDEISRLQEADKDAYTLAQEVLQAVTLEEARGKALIYLGLEQPW